MDWISSKIEHRDVEKLIPYAKNSRTHSDAQIAQIAASIKEFGFTNPILIGKDSVIVAGHGRLLAAAKLGLRKVPCVVLDHLTETQLKALVIADNRIALNAGWDENMLALELEELKLSDFDLGVLGFTDEELEYYFDLDGDDGNSGNTEPDEIPQPPEVATTQPGDIWLLGNHKLMCGDGTHIEHVELLMENEKADLFLTDPPYNVAYTGKTKDALKIQNDSMDGSDFRKFLANAFSCANTFMRPGAAFYVWHADLESYNFRGACLDIGWQVRQCLVWNKNVMVLGRQDYQWKHEPCIYGWKDGAAHFWNSDRKQVTVLDFEKPSRSEEHPTMKPVALFEYIMKNSTKKGDIVIDLFGGSGTTLIAAEMNNRSARLMEIDPIYCDVIVKRWEDFTGKKAELAGDETA